MAVLPRAASRLRGLRFTFEWRLLLALIASLLVLLAPAQAAASGWASLGTASSGVVGDGTETFGYVKGEDFVRLDPRTLASRRVRIGAAGCRPSALARGAALLHCPDRVTRLVLANGAVVPVAASDGHREPTTTGPVGVIEFGDRWLQRIYANGRYELLQWHTGEVRTSTRQRSLDFDAVDPEPLTACGSGQVLDRRGDRALVLRLAPTGGGTVNLVDCRAAKAVRLARWASRDHVRGQLGPEVATWSSRSTTGAVRLGALRPVIYRLRGASPASREPVHVAQVNGRLLVSVRALDGTIELLTRRLPDR